MRRGALVLAALVATACATAPSVYTMAGLDLTRPERVEPLGIHRGAWDDMRACLGWTAKNARLTPDSVLWIVADSIEDRERGVYVYGASVKLSDPVHPWLIIVERAQWRYVHTVSHEEIHVLAQVGNDHPEWAFRCEYPSQVDLPFRRVEER